MRSSERCGSSESDETPRQENNMMRIADKEGDLKFPTTTCLA